MSAPAPAPARPSPPPPAPRRPPLTAQRIDAALSARAVSARFAEQGRQQLADAPADAAARIGQLLAHEAELSAQWQGLPGTDHPRHWQPEAGDEAELSERRSAHRRLDVHLPLWWTLPLAPVAPADEQIDLPLAQRRPALEALVRRHLPRAWTDAEVDVLLDVELRLYWGARGAARQACAQRADRVLGSRALFRFSRNQVVEGTLDDDDLCPRFDLRLTAGVAWAVAVPILRFERRPDRAERLRSRLGTWWRRVLARIGYPARADTDPTFADRLQADENWWAPRLGPAYARLTDAARARGVTLGGLLLPASMPAAALAARAPGAGAAGGHVVIVHGGLSSVRSGFCAALADAGEAVWAGLPLLDAAATWRFEHDSFLTIRRNIARLIAEIDRQCIAAPAPAAAAPGARHVTLFAHSRGGNVVRFALPLLRRRFGRAGWTFSALTMGSPHLGTRVFSRVGERWHGVATVVGGLRNLAMPMLERDAVAKLVNLERGLAYEVPPGFHDVEPEGVAKMARGRSRELPPGMWLVGSHWGPETGVEGGVWDFIVEDLMGAEDESDGLVALDSALGGRGAEAAGRGAPVPLGPVVAYDARPVFHTHYLVEPETRKVVAELLAQAAAWRG